ncbi:MAG: hypothetical protein KC544_13205 [Gemmatimonadetes bacterium]|nr:hypothetical protein [Gemmatimonadota bacterium]MCB9505905.1 hypothetical protein [Gemmatimonadales bacterium]MCA9768032.1 hypothetical protein [Gemmatimonadota bacterium]MCB9519076.1 hypothetical protein [Gemmatimonadales bacterium]HPF62729.1 hypothetical protein [Gemmatimonadales bacterium]
MISYTVYKLVHLFGMFMVFSVLGGIALHAMNGGTKQDNVGRKLVAALHGTALFLILLGGFGMLARLGIVQGGLPGWIYAKLALWVALPVIGMLPYRRPASARWVLLGLPVVGLLAGIIALTKPF